MNKKKILHVTEELSKKNYSISYLIFFLSNFLSNKISMNYDVLTSSIQTQVFKRSKKILILPYLFLKDIFDNNVKLKNYILKYDIIHIHGIWRSINLLSIYFCVKYNKVFFIHPHGMLLKAALRNKGNLNYFTKLIILKIFRMLFENRLKFISITLPETESIKYFFKKSKIFFIPNPVPSLEKDSKYISHSLNKRFVYFGRIHPIKNIDLLIEGFKNANISEDWSLEIYGINDDTKYLKKIKKLSKSHKNIKIRNPVFKREKQKIISNSWANVLLSDSEVLSLSVLESASLNVPSLVNKDIQIDQFTKNEGVITSLDVNIISKKIEEISNWSKSKRILKGEKLNSFVRNKYGIENIYKKYEPLYKDDKVEYKKKLKKFNLTNLFLSSIFDSTFVQISLSYVFNLMIPTLVMLTLTFNKQHELAADVGIISSLIITITQILSSNMRSLIISRNGFKLAEKTISFRIIISFLLIFLIYIIYPTQEIIIFKNTDIIVLISLLILSQWIHEIILSIRELKKETFYFILYNFINAFFSITYLISIFYFFNYFKIFIIFHLGIILYFIILHITSNKINVINNNFFTNIFKNLSSWAFFSSFSTVFSSLFWRLVIYSYYDKAVASILFSSFAIGSFPGTAFNIAIGPTYIKNKLYLNTLLKRIITFLFLIIFALSIISLSIIIFDKYKINFDENLFFYSLSFSLLGSFMMTQAMFMRQRIVQSNINLSLAIFKVDVAYGIFISLICPFFYWVGDIFAISLTFFAGSFSALIIYGFFYKSFKNQIIK